MESEKQPLLGQARPSQQGPPLYPTLAPAPPANAPVVVVVPSQEEKSNFVSLVLFIIGFAVPICWFIGSCVPTSSKFDRTWRIVNRVFCVLCIISGLVVGGILIAAAVAVRKESSSKHDNRCSVNNGVGRCYTCENEHCTSYFLPNVVPCRVRFESDKNRWLDFGILQPRTSMCLSCNLDAPQKCKEIVSGVERCYSCESETLPATCDFFTRKIVYEGEMSDMEKSDWIENGKLPRALDVTPMN